MVISSRIVGDHKLLVNCETGELEILPSSDQEYHDETFVTDQISSDQNTSTAKGKIEYKKFEQKLSELGRMHNFPSVAILEFNLADQAFGSNPAYDYFQNMTRSAVRDLLSNLRDLGVILLRIQGVEPFECKILQPLLHFSSSMGFVTELHSGLLTLPDYLINNTRPELQNGVFITSVYSTNGEINDLITGVKDSLIHITKNIKLLKKVGYEIQVQTPITKKNFNERADILAFVDKLGAKQIFTWPVDEDDFPRIVEDIDFEISEDEYAQLCEEIPEFFDSQDSAFEEILDGKSPIIAIKANGNVYDNRISGDSIGNLTEKNLVSIYQQQDIIKKIETSKRTYDFPIVTNYRYIIRSRLFNREILEKILNLSK